MATKEQHFVPRVYLKQWEGTVATLKEPNKQFTGVYYFDSDSFIGDGKNTGSILWKPHLYTINFDQIYIAEQCPLVYADFVSQVYSLMREREPAPVYGKLGYSNIKTRESVRKHLSQVDTWTFFYYDGNLARSGGILRNIHDLNSYLIENGLDFRFENSWESTLSEFVSELKNDSNATVGESVRRIDMDLTQRVFAFFLMMHCRSPQFNGFGILGWIGELLRNAFGDNINSFVESLWYTELYRMVYGKKCGQYHAMLSAAIEQCQMIFYEAYSGAGTFITSDNPAFLNKRLAPEASNLTGFIFPLSPKYLLFVGKGPGALNEIDYRFADHDTVGLFNRLIYRNRINSIVSCERNLKSVLYS